MAEGDGAVAKPRSFYFGPYNASHGGLSEFNWCRPSAKLESLMSELTVTAADLHQRAAQLKEHL